ncbi:MAG: DUF929 domain-containing protein [Chloroflexi bacterium]|nr:MAG: DUF929 domain-containing protein [Chloroflexota bacterium]
MAQPKRRRRPDPRRPPPSPPAQPGVLVPVIVTLAGVVLLVSAFFVYRALTLKPAPPPPSQTSTASLIAEITAIPDSELARVGAGTADQSNVKRANDPPLRGPDGKPEVLYIGGEFCPYCAAQRWPIIIALSRFGTFSGLQPASSSSTDAFPNTPTFTFRSVSFQSSYLDLVALEVRDRNGDPLQTMTSEQRALLAKYTQNTIPFVDFGNSYVLSGPNYSPQVLAGRSWQQVAATLKDPSSPQAKAILGSAAVLTALTCQITGGQPAATCSLPAIRSLGDSLPR